MNFFIITFLISLLGIALMVGRKLRKLSSGELYSAEPLSFELGTIHFEVWRKNFARILQGLGYFLLVEIIRVYVRLSESTKREWQEFKQKIHDKLTRKVVLDEEGTIKREPNKFLKAMALYKRRLKKINQQVREEEGLDQRSS